jgi:16S rRNA (cytosine967-C5)-methyltransferase
VVARGFKARPLGVKRKTARPADRARKGTAEATPGLDTRRAAAAILQKVIERRAPLDALIDDQYSEARFLALDARDRALTRAILGASLRRRCEIERALTQALDRPLDSGSGALSAILHVAAAQILFLDVPDHAAVDLAVSHAALDRRTRNAVGLVNAVLRRIARERTDTANAPEVGRANTPDWLYARWRDTYGEAVAAAIAEAHLVPPGLDLSVKEDGELWAARLGGTLLPNGTVRLPGTQRVADLPGFAEGAWWVQDAAAALPARLLGDVAGRSVADLCAAPGGKTAQLATAHAAVTGVDISENRLKRLKQNLDRLQLNARLQAADILDWQPDELFDAVLIDAPCTATGTIRRHPDIPWTKRPQDVATLASVQEKLFRRAAEFVKPGGVLVISTCSLEPEESIEHVPSFLHRHPDFALLPVQPEEVAGLPHLLTPEGYLRTLPCHSFGAEEGMQGMDAFFAARFCRTS